MSPGPIRFGHQATVSSADGPGSRLLHDVHVRFFFLLPCLPDVHLSRFVIYGLDNLSCLSVSVFRYREVGPASYD